MAVSPIAKEKEKRERRRGAEEAPSSSWEVVEDASDALAKYRDMSQFGA